MQSAPSSFSLEVLAAARSFARTRQLVRWCPECCQSESSHVLPLCQHSGHRLTGARPVVEFVQRTEHLHQLLVKVVMVPMEVLSVLKHVHLIFFSY